MKALRNLVPQSRQDKLGVGLMVSTLVFIVVGALLTKTQYSLAGWFLIIAAAGETFFAFGVVVYRVVTFSQPKKEE
ncbi:hypothetical protein M1271_06800 [Patescibacteria group bacterium]|nr:hypothetical protein [Patescibacteria group bacterium]MCL5798450.1 hypothetical protein [Patescibacteria group bacterium]